MMDHLLKIVKELHESTPRSILSGSVALNLLGYKTRREPEDIDIYLPQRVKVPELEGMVKIDDSQSYSESDFYRESFMYKDVRIDFFTPEIFKEYHPEITEVYNSILDDDALPFSGIPSLAVTEILKFKIEHALDGKYQDKKHAEDVIYILQNRRSKEIEL